MASWQALKPSAAHDGGLSPHLRARGSFKSVFLPDSHITGTGREPAIYALTPWYVLL